MTHLRSTRKIGIMAAVLTMLVLTVSMAAAAVTFHSGPTPTWGTNSVSVTFNISGLGNDPAYAQLDINASAETFCHNGGKNAKIVPGQNPTLVSGTSGAVALNNSQKNGRDSVTISATAGTPVTPSASEAGCPNGNWTVSLGPVVTVSATLRIGSTPGASDIYGPVTFYP